jgi:tetratricopeptide (TPR) repeat protein
LADPRERTAPREVITQTEFWERLGLVDQSQHVHRLYTPRMLAAIVGVSVAVIRRWQRLGLIRPAREVLRLPYFDFQEVATARRLVDLLAAGVPPREIKRQLAALARYLPRVDRPLAQLSVMLAGKELLLRQGDGLVEPGGQLRFDFEQLEAVGVAEPSTTPTQNSTDRTEDPERLLENAHEREDAGDLQGAITCYRAALVAGGPAARWIFELAELLYAVNDLPAARERYYMAIELDEDFVEARANLGCVLAELGETELAAAALRGALDLHPDFPDAHFHLALALEQLEEVAEARQHWQTFLELAPESPWADTARQRLQSR